MKGIIIVIYFNIFAWFASANVVDDLYSKFHQSEYKVVFERAFIHYVNKSLLEFEVKSFVYNRTVKASNASFMVFDQYNRNEFRFLVQARKFLSNEYRLFPLRFETNLCKSFDENIGGLGATTYCGNFTGCPIIKNTKYVICNHLVDATHFPPLVPTGQYLLELSILTQKYTAITIHSYMNVVRDDSKLIARSKLRARKH